MTRSLYEPEVFRKIINKKQTQLREIQADLNRWPWDHPLRHRWLERMSHLQNGIPALVAKYEELTKHRETESARIAAESGRRVTTKRAKRKKSNYRGLVFIRSKNSTSAKPPFRDVQLLETYNSFGGTLSEIRALVRKGKGAVSVADLKKQFARTDLARAASDSDWKEWNDLFWNKKCRARSIALVFLEGLTGLERTTLKTYLSRARKQKSTRMTNSNQN